MTNAAVSDARDWANKLIIRESRGPGDTGNAIRRISQRYGLDYWELWALRYRPPKRIFHDLYVRLHEAYIAECDRQLRLIEHERQLAKATTGARAALIRAGDVLARKGSAQADVGGEP